MPRPADIGRLIRRLGHQRRFPASAGGRAGSSCSDRSHCPSATPNGACDLRAEKSLTPEHRHAKFGRSPAYDRRHFGIAGKFLQRPTPAHLRTPQRGGHRPISIDPLPSGVRTPLAPQILSRGGARPVQRIPALRLARAGTIARRAPASRGQPLRLPPIPRSQAITLRKSRKRTARAWIFPHGIKGQPGWTLRFGPVRCSPARTARSPRSRANLGNPHAALTGIGRSCQRSPPKSRTVARCAGRGRWQRCGRKLSLSPLDRPKVFLGVLAAKSAPVEAAFDQLPRSSDCSCHAAKSRPPLASAQPRCRMISSPTI